MYEYEDQYKERVAKNQIIMGWSKWSNSIHH